MIRPPIEELAEEMSEFEYLLNAMERAGSEDHPAEHDFGKKRKAVLAYVAHLESLAEKLRAAEAAIRSISVRGPDGDGLVWIVCTMPNGDSGAVSVSSQLIAAGVFTRMARSSTESNRRPRQGRAMIRPPIEELAGLVDERERLREDGLYWRAGNTDSEILAALPALLAYVAYLESLAEARGRAVDAACVMRTYEDHDGSDPKCGSCIAVAEFDSALAAIPKE